jgi:hypothetical protein
MTDDHNSLNFDKIEVVALSRTITAISKNHIVPIPWSNNLRGRLTRAEKTFASASAIVRDAAGVLEAKKLAHADFVAQKEIADRGARAAEEQRLSKAQEAERALLAQIAAAEKVLHDAKRGVDVARDAFKELDLETIAIIAAHERSRKLSPDERQALFARIQPDLSAEAVTS